MASRRDVKKIRFDELGQQVRTAQNANVLEPRELIDDDFQMGAVDTIGRLFLWKFANLDRETCYREIEVCLL